MSEGEGGPRARERQARPDAAERARLAQGFGGVLRVERGARSQVWLASVTGLGAGTIACLESGHRRPSTSTTWKIARGLRPRGTLRDRVALDQRLREAAGGSLVWSPTRPHVARERVRAELVAEAGDGPVASEGDSMAALIIAELARGLDSYQGGAG